MIEFDSDALECDLMETYGIVDYRELPAYRVAMYACGLRDNSRIKIKMAGYDFDIERLLLAGCFDKLSLLFWAQTEDALNGRNKPKSILEALSGHVSESEVSGFDTAEDFLSAWYGKE